MTQNCSRTWNLRSVHTNVSSKIIISHILINPEKSISVMPFCLPYRLSDCLFRLPPKLSVCPVGFQIARLVFRLPCRLSNCPVGFQFALSISVYPVSLSFYVCCLCPVSRVSSKWTKKIFDSNRNKPKQDLFRVCFGLFRETNKEKFSVVSVFQTYIETTETNRTVSKRTEKIRTIKTRRKNLPKHSLAYCSWTNKFFLKKYWNKNKYSPGSEKPDWHLFPLSADRKV